METDTLPPASAVDRLEALGYTLPAVGTDPNDASHRTAGAGVAGLPRNSPVEIQLVCSAV